MRYRELIDFLEHVGKDPSRLIFEDELTGIHNRRFLLSYFEHKVRWESGEDYPLSLIMVDLDHFKRINDSHGHDAGDQTLVWVASLLKEVARDNALPIRHGGDEFMMIVPGADREQGQQLAIRLQQRMRDMPLRLKDDTRSLPVTLSIGVASAPEDAREGKGLIRKADTALYHAKQSGRNQVASAGEIDLDKVFPKTALHRLDDTRIAGRGSELGVVSKALEDLSLRKSQFLILEGAPGMGKSTLLETIRRKIVGNDAYRVVKVSGVQQESYRPYYLTTLLLGALLKQHEDKGAKVLESLSKEDMACLDHMLPHLAKNETKTEDELGGEDEATRREGIFGALVRFFGAAVDFCPLILLIDDLQYADEATLLLLRILIERREVPLLVCGTSMETLKLTGEEEAPPLERFLAARREELGIRTVKLRALVAMDIAEHLQAVFPGLTLPPNLVDELTRVTQGNPLFLSEILRKFVMDQKVTLVGQQWSIEPLEEGYLPRSLTEVITEKIAALDAESRQLLEQATALGEDVSLSLLAGSSEMEETKVLEFLDRAEALGLIKLDFQLNDENLRFLSKRVLEISYGTMEENRREEVHEQVGNYQEKLYQQQILPSASILAYHFKRSANQKKAQRYELLQAAYNQSVFDALEAPAYTGDLEDIDLGGDKPLDPASLSLIPNVFRTVLTSVRNIQLYPPESQAIVRAHTMVKETIDKILEGNDQLAISHSQQVLLANRQRLDVGEYKLLASSFLELLVQSELQEVIFHKGISAAELKAFLVELGGAKPEAFDKKYWRRFASEHGLKRIALKQMRYSLVRTVAGPGKHPGGGGGSTSPGVPAMALEQQLAPEEVARIPQILRVLLGAAKNIKLYPLGSKPVTQSIVQIQESLKQVLSKHPVLTLAGIGNSLLVNGEKINSSDFESLAENFLRFIGSVELVSLTFSEHVSSGEIETFIGELRELPATGLNRKFWETFSREKGLSGLVLNERRYALGVLQSLLIDKEAEQEEVEQQAEEELSEEPHEALREALPSLGKELLIQGNHKLVQKMLVRLFDDFSAQEPLSREAVVTACVNLLDNLILALQHQFTKLAADFLLVALTEEDEARVLGELSRTLLRMSSHAVQFSDYLLSSRILMEMGERQQQLVAGGGSRGPILERKLDAPAQKLLTDDMRSGDPERQEMAAQVLGSLGKSAIPLIIEVIKQERSYRIRHMAATLLVDLGEEAAAHIKRELVLEVTTEQRFRIVEVIDEVTKDLKDELAFALADVNPKVRRAAFQLAERLNNNDVIGLLVEYAGNEDMAVAKGAIRSLANLRPASAVGALSFILSSAREPERAIACSQALAQLGDPASIDALANVLSEKNKYFFSRRWDDQVRATAAFALAQISNPRASEVLSRFTDDSDPRIRQIARTAAGANR